MQDTVQMNNEDLLAKVYYDLVDNGGFISLALPDFLAEAAHEHALDGPPPKEHCVTGTYALDDETQIDLYDQVVLFSSNRAKGNRQARAVLFADENDARQAFDQAVEFLKSVNKWAVVKTQLTSTEFEMASGTQPRYTPIQVLGPFESDAHARIEVGRLCPPVKSAMPGRRTTKYEVVPWMHDLTKPIFG